MGDSRIGLSRDVRMTPGQHTVVAAAESRAVGQRGGAVRGIGTAPATPCNRVFEWVVAATLCKRAVRNENWRS